MIGNRFRKFQSQYITKKNRAFQQLKRILSVGYMSSNCQCDDINERKNGLNLKSWVTGGSKIRHGISSNWRIFESNWLLILVLPVTQLFRSKWLHFFFQWSYRFEAKEMHFSSLTNPAIDVNRKKVNCVKLRSTRNRKTN